MKTEYTLCLLLFWLSTLPLHAQEIITGRITSESNGSPIPYVSIGISNSTLGTVSDENGFFRLVLPADGNALVMFSSVGYSDSSIVVTEIQRNEPFEFKLKPLVHEIPEVHISSRTQKEVIYGNRRRARTTHYNFYHVREEFDDGLGRELGKVLKVDGEITLSELGFYIKGNTFGRVKFRMNVYDLSGGAPDRIDIPTDVLFDVVQPSGWVSVDLVPYAIQLREYRKIGITIQWLQSEHDGLSEKYFSIPAGLVSLSESMYRPKSEAPWDFPKVNISMYVKAIAYLD